MTAFDSPHSSTGVQSAPTQAFEPEQHKPLCRCTDAQILRELWRRKRLVEVFGNHPVATFQMSIMGEDKKRFEEYTWRSVARSIADELVTAPNMMATQIERGPDLTNFRVSAWIITQTTGGRIE